MILGTHDSISYRKPTNLLFRPFAYMGKCQEYDYIDQYAMYKVRCFDLRVRQDLITRKPIVCHGISNYGINIYNILDDLSDLAYYDNEQVYIRLCHENIFPWNTDAWFDKFVEEIKNEYPLFQYMICKKKPTWTVISNEFDKPFIEAQVSPTKDNILKGPYKLLYLQKPNIEKYKIKDVILSVDFVNEL